MDMHANVKRDKAETYNVVAESRGGDASNVVMAGAHLDSVAEGPGINDNGSGSSALLEVAEQMQKVKTPNKVRFAWWGAEEGGLVGSTHYVNDLAANSPEQLENIEMYLNFDMVGSPNYGLFIYDGDGDAFGLTGPDGSDDIEALFERYYAERDIPSEPTAFSGRSDYQAFINNGIPAGGLFTGAEGEKTEAQAAKWGGTAGQAYDPCYHSECDDIENLSPEALDINSDAMAYVTFLYASGKEAINQN
jgi:Zn-dependent M28 family amino/carboxypeptidase